MTDREILITAINRQMEQAPERALRGAYFYFLGCRWQKKAGRTYRSRRLRGPSRSRPGNGKCGKAEKVPQCANWGG